MDEFIHLGDLLIQSGKYEEASFAVRLLDPFHDQFQKNHFQKIGAWLEKGICNWGHTDVLCGEILSKFLVKNIVSLDDLSSWRESSSKWKRRAVPVSLIDLVKSSEKIKDIKSLLDFVEPLMHDKDRFVHQGLGWFLREAWKKQPKPVEAFLLKHKDSAPRKIYQYATEKMSKEQKERYRAAKKKSPKK
ncbi:MAG: DNA alkylation repair protein [Candidatus Omnitrophica bacterium]|nr:DNA alkylation repair protein [Candidatus Omnitrophota bacterium]